MILFQTTKTTSLGPSSFTFDSQPPEQLLADGGKSSEEDEDDLDLTESDLNALTNEEEEDVDIEGSDDYEAGLMIDETPKRKKGFRKDRGVSRLTAFMLFARMTRPKILEFNPGLDFGSLSKKLGEMWTSLPSSEKATWKRKLNKISKGEESLDQPQQSSKLVKIIHQPISRRPQMMISNQMTNQSGLYKVTGTEPIDAAAHLKLLGESLSVIGQRLTDNQGLIAVSGSLSVLLDSLLCSMGPLICLTKQVPELQDAVPQETLNKILDNIAYVMPGL